MGEMSYIPQEQKRGSLWGLLLGLMAEPDQEGEGHQGRAGSPETVLVQLPGLCQALPTAPVVNGNLMPVSMAVGKINADKATQERERP